MHAKNQVFLALAALVVSQLVGQTSFAQNACPTVFGGGAKARTSLPKIEPRTDGASLANSNNKSKELVSNDSNSLKVVDLDKGGSTVIPGQFAGIYFEGLSDDGSRLVIGSRTYSEQASPILPHPAYMGDGATGGLRVIDVASGKILHHIRPGTIHAFMSVDGKTLVSKHYEAREISVHDLDTGVLIRTIKGDPRELSPDGTRLLVHGLIYDSLVDVRTGKTVMRLFDRGTAKFDPAGDKMWYVNGRSVKIRDLTTDTITFQTELPKGTNKYANTSRIDFSNDGKIVTISAHLSDTQQDESDLVYVLNRETGQSSVLPYGTSHQTKISQNGRFVAVSNVKEAAVYDTTTFQKVYEFTPELYFKNMINGVDFIKGDRQLKIRRETLTLTVDLNG
jgi:hypothetical protein